MKSKLNIFKWFFWLSSSLSITLSAQEVPRPEIDLDDFIQKLAATQGADVNYEDLYESLLQFYLNPIELNKTNKAELRNLNLLSEIQINELSEYLKKERAIESLYELQALTSFDQETLKEILPFLTITKELKASDVTGVFNRATNHFFIYRMEQTLERSKGFREGRFLGSPQKMYARYQLQHPKDFSLGLIVEKDAGEKNYADYATFHFQLQNKGSIKNAIVGDYQLQFGQGLIVSGGYAAGKGGEPIYTTRRSDLGMRPHNSVLESGFFRGGAVTINKANIDFTTFVSYNKRNASINRARSDESEEVFSSLLVSGLHRTDSELAKKGILNELALGVNAKFKFENGHIGFTVLNSEFSAELERTPRYYSTHEFSGRQNLVAGPNFTYSWQNFNFFGEAARSSSGGTAANGGWVAALSPQLEWATHFRSYDKNYHSFYANAFGEGSRTINERGVYSGIKYSPSRKYVFAAFYDRYVFPWARYLVDAPSHGADYLLRFTYKPSKTTRVYAQYHREQKQRNQPDNDSPSDFLVNTYRSNLLTNLDIKITRKWKSQTRLQRNTFTYEGQATSQGFAIIQDVEGSWGPLQVKTRLAYFDTDTYDSRIYAYENDVLYAVSFPAYFGRGTRWYIMSRYRLTPRMDIWFRLSRTQLREGETIGSGLNLIEAPHRTDLKLQVRYKF